MYINVNMNDTGELANLPFFSSPKQWILDLSVHTFHQGCLGTTEEPHPRDVDLLGGTG